MAPLFEQDGPPLFEQEEQEQCWERVHQRSEENAAVREDQSSEETWEVRESFEVAPLEAQKGPPLEEADSVSPPLCLWWPFLGSVFSLVSQIASAVGCDFEPFRPQSTIDLLKEEEGQQDQVQLPSVGRCTCLPIV